jgi:hypothetical protein
VALEDVGAGNNGRQPLGCRARHRKHEPYEGAAKGKKGWVFKGYLE